MSRCTGHRTAGTHNTRDEFRATEPCSSTELLSFSPEFTINRTLSLTPDQSGLTRHICSNITRGKKTVVECVRLLDQKNPESNYVSYYMSPVKHLPVFWITHSEKRVFLSCGNMDSASKHPEIIGVHFVISTCWTSVLRVPQTSGPVDLYTCYFRQRCIHNIHICECHVATYKYRPEHVQRGC